MNDRISLAVRILATDENDVRKRVAIAASTLARTNHIELQAAEYDIVAEIVKEAQRFPAKRDANGDVTATAFEETAQRGTRKSAHKIAVKIWDLYCNAK